MVSVFPCIFVPHLFHCIIFYCTVIYCYALLEGNYFGFGDGIEAGWEGQGEGGKQGEGKRARRRRYGEKRDSMRNILKFLAN